MSYIGSYVWNLRQKFGTQRLIVAGVGVILTEPNGDIWLGKRADGGEWAYIGGAFELGHSARQTASKETEEETGLIIPPESWTFVAALTNPKTMSYTYPNGDEVQIVNFIFQAPRPPQSLLRTDEEHTEFRTFSLTNLPTPLKSDIIAGLDTYRKFLDTRVITVD